jgi:hypothetical protein
VAALALANERVSEFKAIVQKKKAPEQIGK